MPPLLPVPNPSKLRRTIACLGDSLTQNISRGTIPYENWPGQLERWLTQTDPITDGESTRSPAILPPIKANCRCRNFAKEGATSGPYAAANGYANTVTSATNITLTVNANGTG